MESSSDRRDDGAMDTYQDLTDAAADAAMDAHDDRPTRAELDAEARADSLGWTGWSEARRSLVVEEYDRDRAAGMFDDREF